MRYSASLDTVSKWITIGCIAFFSFITFEGIYNIVTSESTRVIAELAAIVAADAIPIAVWLFAPSGYEVGADSLHIVRPAGNVSLLYGDILQVCVVPDSEMAFTIRAFGSGGLFGYFGKMMTAKYGISTWYATQRHNYILLTLRSGKTVVITPDDLSIAQRIMERLF